MNSTSFLSFRLIFSRAAALGLGLSCEGALSASTLWTGPNTNFTQSTTVHSDTFVPGKVVLTRGGNGPLYNSAAGEVSGGTGSPKDTMWAFGTLANYNTLTYQTFDSLRNGNLAGRILNQNMVVHLVNEDIYLSIKFTAWGQHFAGGFSYTRSTPAVVVAPTVSLTSPSAGSVFAASASIPLTANATVTSGAVTNVAYFAGTTLLCQATASPFSATGSIATPGNYSLTAVATAGGISATSSVVSITVISPPTATLTAPTSGSVFAAPANLKLSASASVTGSTVTNVSFLNNSTLLGSVQNSPFNFTANNLPAGNYSLTAVATASGISGTSAVVNVSIVTPTAISMSQPKVSAGQFSFSYSTDPGLSYLVQGTADLKTWVPVLTNVATANPSTFSTPAAGVGHFYRVGRLPNP